MGTPQESRCVKAPLSPGKAPRRSGYIKLRPKFNPSEIRETLGGFQGNPLGPPKFKASEVLEVGMKRILGAFTQKGIGGRMC